MNPSIILETTKPPTTARTWAPKEPWQQLGVYRTFPFPLTPLPPFTPRVRWTNPLTGKKY